MIGTSDDVALLSCWQSQGVSQQYALARWGPLPLRACVQRKEQRGMLRRISKAQEKMVVVPSILAMAVIVFLMMSLLPAVADAQKNNKDSEPTDAKNTKTAQSTTANNDEALTTAAKKKKAAEFAKGTGASG